MATTSPPSPPAPQPPSAGQPPRGTVRSRRASNARIIAIGALALIALIVLYLVFGSGGGANYHLIFPEAGQLVRGDQVQVGGVPVGSVTEIELTPDDRAKITIHVDGSLTPLHAGTKAQVRTPSLSSVANRYIQLSPGPNNARALPAGATKEVTDLDQLLTRWTRRRGKASRSSSRATPRSTSAPARNSANRPNTSARSCPRPTTSSPSWCATSRSSPT